MRNPPATKGQTFATIYLFGFYSILAIGEVRRINSQLPLAYNVALIVMASGFVASIVSVYRARAYYFVAGFTTFYFLLNLFVSMIVPAALIDAFISGLAIWAIVSTNSRFRERPASKKEVEEPRKAA